MWMGSYPPPKLLPPAAIFAWALVFLFAVAGAAVAAATAAAVDAVGLQIL